MRGRSEDAADSSGDPGIDGHHDAARETALGVDRSVDSALNHFASDALSAAEAHAALYPFKWLRHIVERAYMKGFEDAFEEGYVRGWAEGSAEELKVQQASSALRMPGPATLVKQRPR
jgi:hypothetical protein